MQSTDTDNDQTTFFGNQQIPIQEKQDRVDNVFFQVADRYDIMNDAMSLGLHRLWKKITIELLNVRTGQQILDLASGTGDLAAQLAQQVGDEGLVIASDINNSMLSKGRERHLDQGLLSNINYIQANGELLPFADNTFHAITLAFGLRNMTHLNTALSECQRILKPGGQIAILEFSKPSPLIKPIYDAYSLHVIPLLGEWIVKDRDSYQYLVESIRKHPDQLTLQQMMESAGFDKVNYYNLAQGIVAIHQGYKY